MKQTIYAGLIASISAVGFSAPVAARQDQSVAQEEQLFQSACQMFQSDSRDKVGVIEALDKFLKTASDAPLIYDAQFLIGQAYMEQALNILKAEAKAKKSSAARLMAPRNQSAVDALENARTAFHAVADHNKKSGLGSSAQYRLGEISYDQKDWSGAIDEFHKVEKSFPKAYIIPESWIGIIYADIALEKFNDAESELFLLGETYPNYLKLPEVLYAHGIISLHKGDYADAEKSLKQVQTAEAQFYLGKTYLLSKRPFLAATAFDHLVQDYPDSDLKEDSDFFIGDSFFLAKDYDGAITKYERFQDKYPDSRLKVAALFRIGSAYFQKQSYVDARANFQALLDRYPQDFFAPLAQYFIAESYLVAGQMREALFAYTKVITQFPETIKVSPLAHYKLAWTQLQVSDYAQATQTCHNFLDLYPSHALAKNVYLIMGNALQALKRYNEAVTAWQHIIDISPSSEIAEQALFSILLTQYKLKNFDSILTSYQFIFRHLPPSQSKWRSLSYLYAAEAYLGLNQVDEAQAIYEMILKVYPNELAAFYAQDGLAWSYSLRGDDQNALVERQKLKEMLDVARSTFVFTGTNQLGIADSMFNQKNYEDAFNLYDKFLKENPQAPEAPSALYRAGMSLYYLRYYTQAVDTWTKLQQNYPKAPEVEQAAFQIADTLFRAQKYAQAVEAYRGIIDKFPNNQQIPLSYLRIAQAAFNAKDNNETIRQAKALLDRFPSAPEATDALDLLEALFDRAPSVNFQEVLGGIVKEHPRTPIAGDAQFRLARRLFDRKDYAGAAEQFQNFSVDFTDSQQLPKAQFMLAESLFQGAKYTDAIPAFQRCLNNFQLGNDMAVAVFHLASAYYNLKQYQQASTYYQRIAEEYPNSEFVKAAEFNLALCYKSLGKLDSAQDAYEKYIHAAGPKDQTSQAAQWEVFGIQKDRKDYEAALATLQQIQAASGSDAKTMLESTYRTGEIYALMDRQDDAAQAWEKLVGMKPVGDPFRLQGLIKLGEAYEKTNPGRAIAVYEDLARNSGNKQLAQAAREKVQALRGGSGGGDAKAHRKTKKSGHNTAADSDAPGDSNVNADAPAPKSKPKTKSSDQSSDAAEGGQGGQ